MDPNYSCNHLSSPCFRATDLGFLYYGFWNGRTHVERLMRSNVVALFEPAIDDDLGLYHRREPVRIENLPAQRAVESLVVSILPGRSAIDTDWFDSNPSKPVLRCFGSKLGPVFW